MSLKKLIIIVAIVLFLGVLVLVKALVQKKQDTRQEIAQEQATELALTKGIPESQVSKITLYKGDDEKNKVIFTKDSAGAWRLASQFDVRAKKESIEGILNAAGDLKGQLRGESKEVFADFAIEDKDCAHIVIDDALGRPWYHLVVSFLRLDWDKTFVRLAGSQKVALVQRDILSSLNLYNKEGKLEYVNFADLKVCLFDAAKIQKIELASLINKTSKTLVLKKSAAKEGDPLVWNFQPPAAKGEDIDVSKVDEFLRNISNLYAKDVADPQGTGLGFDSPTLELTLEDSDGQGLFQLEVGKYVAAEKLYYLKSSSPDQVFKVSDADIQNLRKEKAYFLKPKETKKKK